MRTKPARGMSGVFCYTMWRSYEVQRPGGRTRRTLEEEDEFLQAVPQDQTMNVLPLLNRYAVEIPPAIFFKNKMCAYNIQLGRGCCYWVSMTGDRVSLPAWEPGFQGTALAPLASAPPEEEWRETVVQRIAVSTLSERKTRTLTLTYLERDATPGDRKRDVERKLDDLSGAAENTIPDPSFHKRFHALRTGTHSHRISAALYKVQMFGSVISDRKVTSDTVVRPCHWKSTLCAFHVVQRCKHAFISLFSDSHTKDLTHFSLGEKMYNSVVQHIAHPGERQDISACITRT